jgi:RNA polymerase sigma-70 factor (ECF subfamily)
VLSQPEEPSLDGIVRAEGDGLFRFLVWSLRDREEAHDALQEVLIRVHRGLGGLRDPLRLKQWLYRIATNVARDARSRRRRRPTTFGLSVQEDDAVALVGGAVASPAENVEADELRVRLSDALAALPPELREPLLLHVVSGLKYREIADALGWPMGTVTTRIHAARKRLVEALADR